MNNKVIEEDEEDNNKMVEIEGWVDKEVGDNVVKEVEVVAVNNVNESNNVITKKQSEETNEHNENKEDDNESEIKLVEEVSIVEDPQLKKDTEVGLNTKEWVERAFVASEDKSKERDMITLHEAQQNKDNGKGVQQGKFREVSLENIDHSQGELLPSLPIECAIQSHGQLMVSDDGKDVGSYPPSREEITQVADVLREEKENVLVVDKAIEDVHVEK
ncbi:hypothetical protein K7X08_000212 [Anisodus acutangulus]|uniref:Uncharacterized protein n=1 Tax=Anisodus acutangulus TaxID=402998 RepID=A0A9Q1M814_9SOLA|nr:hypothetical protein K7X08_000212 [Anisodus acutangulus]